MSRAPAVVLGVALVGILGLGAAACGSDDPAPSVTSTTSTPTPTGGAGEVSLYDVAVGDCLRDLGAGRDLTVRLVDCDRPHQAEVYAEVAITGERFPGVDTVARQAATACAPRFAAYTGEAAGPGTTVAFVEVVPTADSWAAGDRSALCLAVGPDGTALRGSIAAG